VIGLPFNDWTCLGAISEVIAQLVADRDPILVELANQHSTADSLIAYLRALPQRDDLGDRKDGPRVDACQPSQRVRFGASDPNCVERAALFLGVEELRDPGPTRQLATIDTEYGPHTFPLVNGKPILLDPRVTPDCVECGLALAAPGPVAISPRNAIGWAAELAGAGAAPFRNGPSRLYRARNAMRRMVEEGAAPAKTDVDAMGFLFALAERAAQRYGSRAIAIVRTTARAVADLLDAVLAQGNRNTRFQIGDLKFDTPQWLDSVATAAGRVGLDLGSMAVRSKLGALGVGADVVGLVEDSLNKEGLSLGSLAHPPALATFARFASARTV
jgi:hypothetical protein